MFIRLLLALACGVIAIAAAAAQTPSDVPARKILFIGDSFTYAQGGLDNHFARLAASASPPLVVSAARAVQGGAFLKVLWELRTPVNAIETGNFDVVVLQDDIPETNVDYFRQYARMFVEAARRRNARPVLFMAWPYQRLGWISMQEIARAHRQLAQELNVDVAPAGLAWQRSTAERPSLDMYDSDREHPSIYGTYLATCVTYATVYNKNPAGLTYVPAGITPDVAAFLQRIAWQTVQDYRAGKL